MSDASGTVRWSVSVPKETDLSVREYLAKTGQQDETLSEFVADAVKWRLFDLNVGEARAANQQANSEAIEAAIDQALSQVRAERRGKSL